MTEIILGIAGSLLVLAFLLWLGLGKRVTSKTGTLLIDTGLVALCIVTVLCGLQLRLDKLSQGKSGQEQHEHMDPAALENLENWTE